MSTQQLSDPGISGEWLPVEDRKRDSMRAAAASRREQSQRVVKKLMLGLVAFTLLGIACFAWRQHSLQADMSEPAQPAQP